MKGGNKGEVAVIKGKGERINVLTKGEDYDEEGEIKNIPSQFMNQMAEIGQRLNKPNQQCGAHYIFKIEWIYSCQALMRNVRKTTKCV